MEYLIRLIQKHGSFRKAEIDALADLHGLVVEWVQHSNDVGQTSNQGRVEKRWVLIYSSHALLFS